MAETKLLPKIGSKVKININKVKDRLPSKLIDEISTNPRVVTTGYKMTDGRSIGITVGCKMEKKIGFSLKKLRKVEYLK